MLNDAENELHTFASNVQLIKTPNGNTLQSIIEHNGVCSKTKRQYHTRNASIESIRVELLGFYTKGVIMGALNAYVGTHKHL